MKDVLMFARGQIWMQKGEAHPRSGFRNSVQGGGRPYLIVTSDYGCETSPVLTAVPITSKEHSCHVNVPITMPDGTPSWVQCNQISTVSTDDFSHYMGTVSPVTMKKIEDTMLYAMGIVRDTAEVPSVAKIKEIVENTAIMKFNELSTTQETNALVEEIARSLEDVYDKLKKSYVNNLHTAEKRLTEKLSQTAPALDVVTSTPTENITIPEVPVCSRVEEETAQITASEKSSKRTTLKRPKGYWTLERNKEFIADRDIMPMNAWLEKYGFTSPVQGYKRYWVSKQEIAKAENNS